MELGFGELLSFGVVKFWSFEVLSFGVLKFWSFEVLSFGVLFLDYFKRTGASFRERLSDIKRLEKDLFFIFFKDDRGVVATETEGV